MGQTQRFGGPGENDVVMFVMCKAAEEAARKKQPEGRVRFRLQFQSLFAQLVVGLQDLGGSFVGFFHHLPASFHVVLPVPSFSVSWIFFILLRFSSFLFPQLNSGYAFMMERI